MINFVNPTRSYQFLIQNEFNLVHMHNYTEIHETSVQKL